MDQFSNRAEPSAESRHSRTAWPTASVRCDTAKSKGCRPFAPPPSHRMASALDGLVPSAPSTGGIFTSAPSHRSRSLRHLTSSSPCSSLESCKTWSGDKPESSNLWLSERGGGLRRVASQAAKPLASSALMPEAFSMTVLTRTSSMTASCSSATYIQSRSPKPSGSLGLTLYFLQIVRYKSVSCPVYLSRSRSRPSSFDGLCSLYTSRMRSENAWRRETGGLLCAGGATAASGAAPAPAPAPVLVSIGAGASATVSCFSPAGTSEPVCWPSG
mmetsp:Transcript_2673/g.6557  ORF Transcript_2673/g.6557 Transcript_2673/m.6557 type:complete len:272 (+) Transcript_2673:3310-4125(+)